VPGGPASGALLVAAVLLAATSGGRAQAPQPAQAAADVPYTVECGPDPEGTGTLCLVDRDTYVGWRTFHGICHTCHAQDAVGSSFAPSLLERMQEIDKARFMESLDQGVTGQSGVMPAWNENPNVNKYYEQLWSYLRARADGALLPGRPKRLPDSR
jgi:cytochrome c5